jgi:hypothetical protein
MSLDEIVGSHFRTSPDKPELPDNLGEFVPKVATVDRLRGPDTE